MNVVLFDNLYVTQRVSPIPVKIPVEFDTPPVFGVNNETCGAGKVQFLFALYESAATISSSSITTICVSGYTLPTLLGSPLGCAKVSHKL